MAYPTFNYCAVDSGSAVDSGGAIDYGSGVDFVDSDSVESFSGADSFFSDVDSINGNDTLTYFYFVKKRINIARYPITKTTMTRCRKHILLQFSSASCNLLY